MLKFEEFKKFAQRYLRCLSKNDLDDPELKKSKNLEQFLFLKTAAILQDREFVNKLYMKMDESVPSRNQPDCKQRILKFLEAQGHEKDHTQLKKELIRVQASFIRDSYSQSKYGLFASSRSAVKSPTLGRQSFEPRTINVPKLSRSREFFCYLRQFFWRSPLPSGIRVIPAPELK